MKKAVVTLLSAAGLSFADPVPLIDVDASIGYIMQGISGKASYEGGEISLKDQLKLGNSNNVFVKIKFEHPVPILPNLYFQYTPATFKGENSESITWGGTTFTGTIKSSFQANRTDVGIYWNLPVPVVDLELGLVGRIFDFKGAVTGQAGSIQRTEESKLNVPIPMLYFGAGGYFPTMPVGLFGDFKIITYGNATYTDLSAEVRGKFMLVYGALGYRSETLRIDIKDRNISSNITISGPYLKLGVEF